MDERRNKLFCDYAESLYGRKMSYATIGRYMKHAADFLEKAESVSRKGYLSYLKEEAFALSRDRYGREAVCDFLFFAKVGYGRNSRSAEKVVPLEKKTVLAKRNTERLNRFTEYLNQENDYSPNTVRAYADTARKFFLYADEPTQENCRRFVAALEAEGLNPSTVNLRITGLEKLAEWMKKPVRIKRLKMRKKLDTDNVPSPEEYARLTEYLSGKKDRKHYFWVKILATTGARLSEFLRFGWEDILAGEVTLRGKGGKYRRFFFTEELRREVRAWSGKESPSGPVATNRRGDVISTRGIGELLKRWGRKCGIDAKKMHAHAFRHFFAKMYLKKNKDVVQLAEILGHGSVDTTRIYLQKTYDEQKRDFNRSVTW